MTTTNRSTRTNPAVKKNTRTGVLLIIFGVLSIVFSIVIAFTKTFITLVNFFWTMPRGGTFFSASSPGAFLLLLGICLVIFGGKRISLNNRYRKLTDQLELRPTVYLEELASYLGKNPTQILTSIAKMQRKGFWRAVTVLDNAVVAEPLDSAAAYKILAIRGMSFSEGKRKERVSYPLLLLLIVGPTLLLPLALSKFWLVPLAVIASVLVFLISSAFTPSQPIIDYHMTPKREPIVVTIEKTGNETSDPILEEGQKYLNQLAALQVAIENPDILGNLYDISASLTQLLSLLKEEPGKYQSVRKLMNFSLPTTIRLLESYVNLNAQPVKGENIVSSMNKIEEMSGMVANNFRKELDSLYHDRSLGIEVDIEVMEQILNQDDFDLKL